MARTQQAQQAAPELEAAREVVDRQARSGGEQLSLDEMTRIMDVASTLRKEQALAEHQLNLEDVKAELRERLLKGAEVSGDPVTAEQVDTAVDLYYERRHTFAEPPLSISTALAHVYVRRGSMMKWAVLIGAVVATFWGLLLGGFFPGERRDAKLATQRYEEIQQEAVAINELTSETATEAEVAQLLAVAKIVRGEHNPEELAEIATQLRQIRAELDLQYELTIPASPDKESAFPLDYTDANSHTVRTGYYVVVEARTADGTPVRVPIRDRRSERTELTSRWAEQVPESVYERLKQDKQSDGLLDERVFGVKQRGKRSVETRLLADGQQIERGGQLTKW